MDDLKELFKMNAAHLQYNSLLLVVYRLEVMCQTQIISSWEILLTGFYSVETFLLLLALKVNPVYVKSRTTGIINCNTACLIIHKLYIKGEISRQNNTDTC